MGKHQNNFKEYLLNKFEDKFYKVINSWLYDNGEDFIDADSYKTTSFKVIDIQDSSLYAGNKGDGIVEVDLNINPTIQYNNYLERGYYDVEEEIRKWLTLSFEYNINNDTIGFIDVDSYNPNRKKKPLNGDLAPIISREEYENYAEEILAKYYPEALEGTPVNPYLLAQRMNIDIEEVDCNDDNTFAKIYLGDRGTRDKIILNIGLCDECSDAARNITITHECVHKDLHKLTYLLYKKLLSNNPEFNCGLDGALYNGNLRMPEFLEIQANAIAPMVLMPKRPILSDYLDVKNHNLMIYKNETNAIKETIEYLKGKYGVTMYAIKKRLFDLGVHEVKGISNYIDDNYIPDYYFKKGSLNYDEEFVIGFSDFVKAFCKSPNWLRLTNYIYVQGFLVLRNKKYVEHDQQGNVKLTNYALSHIDECCVKFRVNKKITKNNHPFYQLGYLNRDNFQSYDYDHDIIVGDKTLNDEETLDCLSDFCIDISETMKELAPLSWNKCIEHLMEAQGLTVSSLAVNTGGSTDINKRTVARYVNGEIKEPKKEKLTAICLALNIPIMISNHIFNKAGIYLNPLNEYDNAIFVTLTTLRGRSLEEINKLFLKMFGKTLI